jgi:hypothetical protein
MCIRSACRPGGVLLLCLLSAGCSHSGTVSGKVKYQGEPLGGGTVVFVGAQTVRSDIGPDGSYTIANIPAGTVKIAVETQSAQPVDESAMRMGMPQIPKDVNLPPEAQNSMYKASGGSKGKYVRIPDAFADPEKSGLTLEVTGGNQHHDIELR